MSEQLTMWEEPEPESPWPPPPLPEPPEVTGEIFELMPHQVRAVDATLTGLKDFRSFLNVMPTGTGKCLGRGTPVLKACGDIVAVENVRMGDVLAGPGGAPRTVLSTTSGVGFLYRILPVKGQPWICNDVHVLTLIHTETGRTEDIPLNEYLPQAKYWKHCRKLLRSAVDFSPIGSPYSSACPVDPYFLGLVLGDGCVRNGGVSVCKPDREVLDECQRQAGLWGLHVRTDPGGGTSVSHYLTAGRIGSRQNPLFAALNAMGLAVTGERKFIPQQYKTASRENRLAVLAGLLDADGHLDESCFDFVSVSQKLAHDVAFVARSLGMAAQVQPCRKGCQTGAVGDYYRLCISGDTEQIPTRIPRKQAHARRQKKDVLRTGFTVEPVGNGEYFGFELDGDGRFLLGDFTVTHNTRVATEVARRRKRDQILFLAHRDELLSQAVRRFGNDTGEIIGLDQAQWFGGEERIIVGSIQTISKPTRLERFQPKRFDLVIVDEAHHVMAATYRRVVDYFAGAKILGLTATPDRKDEKALSEVFEDFFVYDIEDAMADGVLCDILIAPFHIHGLDLSTVKTK